MTAITFKLKISTLDKKALNSPTPFDVDGVTQNGRLYRAGIVLIEPFKIDDDKLADLCKIIKDLIPAIIKAGYHAPDVERMTFTVRDQQGREH